LIHAWVTKGSIYTLLLIGGLVVVGTWLIRVTPGGADRLSTAEFVAAEVVGATLLVAGGILNMLITRSANRAIAQIEAAHQDASAHAADAAAKAAEAAVGRVREAGVPN
jgi:hypothetical protein